MTTRDRVYTYPYLWNW